MKRVPADRYLWFFLLVCAGVGGDLYTKSAVFDALGYPRGMGKLYSFFQGRLTFQHFTSFNEGALWGLGQGYSWLFASLSVVAVVGVVYWLFVRGGAQSLWLTVALSLIVAGALGNLYDRLGLHGYLDRGNGEPLLAVRDFLLFTFGTYAWPVFNFADVFLVSGATMLVLQSLNSDAEDVRGAEATAAPEREGEPQQPDGEVTSLVETEA
jgi:signal peptidase II